MNKRILFTVLVVMMVLTHVYASVSDGVWENTDNAPITSDSENQAAKLDVSFDMKQAVKDSVRIGFTGDELDQTFSVEKEKPTVKTSATLVDSDGDGKATNGESEEDKTINVYYQITSTKTLYVSLKMDGPLTYSPAGGEPSYIGWSATWDSNKSVSRKDSETTGSDSELLYSHTPNASENPSAVSAGYETLTISTDSYSGKPTGKYQGAITVFISTESSVAG